jgi:hypothetical protein
MDYELQGLFIYFLPSHVLTSTLPSYLLLLSSVDVDIKLDDDVDSEGQKTYLEVVCFLFFEFLLSISDWNIDIE